MRMKPPRTSAHCVLTIGERFLNGIKEHLTHQPKFVSRTRIKAMVQPFWSQFRLRVEDFRVYYDVNDESHAVNVLRVLQKTTQATPETTP